MLYKLFLMLSKRQSVLRLTTYAMEQNPPFFLQIVKK